MQYGKMIVDNITAYKNNREKISVDKINVVGIAVDLMNVYKMTVDANACK
jgi:hypothetical protein